MIETLTKLKLTTLNELPIKTGQLFLVGDEEIVVIRLTNGVVKAIENKSPHPKGGTLVDGLISGTYLFCPCYDWKINLEDGIVQKPDSGQVKTYDVEVIDNDVYLVR